MSKYYAQLIGFLAIIIISIIDYLVVIDISLSIIYLLPISLTSWYGKRWFSILLVLISTTGWFVAEFTAKTNLYVLVLLWNTVVRLIVFLTIAYLISTLKIAYEKEKKLAQTDGLTGIVNQRFFLELLRIEYKRSLRYGHYVTLAYFDLDNFKQINDRFGHNTGDKLLKTVARTIQKQIRETDIIARLGGDEFALLLPETNYQSGQAILLRLQQRLKTAMEAYSPTVSLSIGVVTFLTFPNSVDEMLKQADSLMYKVKKSGKNRIEYQVFNPALDVKENVLKQ
ncbi:Diguanylate cyclase (GGDEF) domain-containing protein [Hyella patelloides LEGE 07179]|uniref:Diguanylate cyclase (GGDEF) domain-containing protein n=1 Tax=Hyella patelloides LEGE 07179 TaxID=945734 RepID=A0A563VJ00_9CYAN|nr:diguanylate cyclase [Hyella patelloides]VEP11414.1 Diguanylate cyclase (GGDEF) domain-containing protein [Hyella patelloides LEGE 07179]